MSRKYNRFQRNNLKVMTPGVLIRLKEGDWRDIPIRFFKCVRCGSRVTSPNLEYYDFDATRVMCYWCQNSLKQLTHY